MKLTKRILALVLALVMVLAMSIPVLADESHSHKITILNSHSDYEYKAYQVFAGDLSKDGVLSNISWGKGIDGPALLAALKDPSINRAHASFATANTVADVAAILASDSTDDNAVAVAFAHVAAMYVKDTEAYTATYTGTQYEINVLGDGYYLVVNTKVPTGEDNTTYSRYILEVVRNVTVSHKGTYPVVVKKIVEGEERVDTNEKSIGDKVNYEITGSIPTNIADYDTYFYRFVDTLSKGLTYNKDMKVTVNGKDVTQYFHVAVSEYSETDGTTIKVAIEDLLALELLTDPAVGSITKDTKVILTYSATLNDKAVIAGTGNPNKVKLDYSNNPNDDGDGATLPPPPNPEEPTPKYPIGETPEDEVKTFTTELNLFKVDGTGVSLKGAQFELTGASVKWVIIDGNYFEKVAAGTGDYWLLKDGTYTTTVPVTEDDPATPDVNEKNIEAYAIPVSKDYVLRELYTAKTEEEGVSAKAFVDENGFLKLTGLGTGTYTLTETVTPQGFNTIAPITFEIKFDPKTEKFSTGTDVGVIYNESTNTFQITVQNVAGSTLPSTGGMGTTLFYVFGSVMFIGAAVLLITKKRMAA